MAFTAKTPDRRPTSILTAAVVAPMRLVDALAGEPVIVAGDAGQQQPHPLLK